LVRDKKYPVRIFDSFEGRLDFDWQEVFELFKKPKVDVGLKIDFPKLDSSRIKELLVDRHEFSLERVEKQLEKLQKGKGRASQQTLF